MTTAGLVPVSWPRMVRAVEKVRDRLLRAAQALEKAGISYAVAGGHAVAAWVSRVDGAAVRNTREIGANGRRRDGNHGAATQSHDLRVLTKAGAA